MKQITTTIADLELVYDYTYSPGLAPITHGPADNWDPGSGSDISLEGPYIVMGQTRINLGGLFEAMPSAAYDRFTDALIDQIEQQESESCDDARAAADEDRYERLRDERDGL